MEGIILILKGNTLKLSLLFNSRLEASWGILQTIWENNMFILKSVSSTKKIGLYLLMEFFL